MKQVSVTQALLSNKIESNIICMSPILMMLIFDEVLKITEQSNSFDKL